MPKYLVLVTADATVSTEIAVEAATPDEAQDEALKVARRGGWPWELDEGNHYEPYIADPETAATPLQGEEYD